MNDVQKAIAAVKANPPHPDSPLPWRVNGKFIEDSKREDVGGIGYRDDAAHIAAAVNAAPVLLAEVERLQCTLVAQAKRASLPVDQLRHDDLAEHLADRIAELEAQLEAARVALIPVAHAAWCDALAFRSCDCDAQQNHVEAVAKARRALGLEVEDGR